MSVVEYCTGATLVNRIIATRIWNLVAHGEHPFLSQVLPGIGFGFSSLSSMSRKNSNASRSIRIAVTILLICILRSSWFIFTVKFPQTVLTYQFPIITTKDMLIVVMFLVSVVPMLVYASYRARGEPEGQQEYRPLTVTQTRHYPERLSEKGDYVCGPSNAWIVERV